MQGVAENHRAGKLVEPDVAAAALEREHRQRELRIGPVELRPGADESVEIERACEHAAPRQQVLQRIPTQFGAGELGVVATGLLEPVLQGEQLVFAQSANLRSCAWWISSDLPWNCS
jgi:hypothetical protein